MARLVLLLAFTFAVAQPVCAQRPVQDRQERPEPEYKRERPQRELGPGKYPGIDFLLVPVGEAFKAKPVMLRGTVQGSRDELLPCTPVTIKDAPALDPLQIDAVDSIAFSGTTDAKGQFQLLVEPGKYIITAKPIGFATTSKEVFVLFTNQSVTVRVTERRASPDGKHPHPPLTHHDCDGVIHQSGGLDPLIARFMEGKTFVPTAGLHQSALAGTRLSLAHEEIATLSTPPLDVPIPASGAVAVSGAFSTSVDLAAWLNGQSARNLRLQAIVSPDGGNQNLFVWIAHPGADQHFVISANQIINTNDLQSILKAYPQASVIGLVWVMHDRFLVLRSNP